MSLPSKQLAPRLLALCTAASAVLWVAAAGLWVWTEPMGRTESFVWGEAGAYRCLEFAEDDADYRAVADPGFAPTPFRWHRRRGGWVRPPGPSNPAALPPGSVTWVIPHPDGQFAPTTHGGVAALGFEHATFAGWYGPGTSARSYRFSYFLVLIPAGVLPVVWLARRALRRWRHGRYGPGQCRACGYDLRASPDRCPECGATSPLKVSSGRATQQ